MAVMCGRWLALVPVCLVAGCGGGGIDQFAPACPRPAILRDANDLQRFRGNGQDFLDTTLQGRITSLTGSCAQDGSRIVSATVQVGLELSRGPAAAARATSVSFFVAVSQGDHVLDKQVYTIETVFPENTDRLHLTGEPVTLRLPVTKTVRADAYQITAGFQLTPTELAANRRRIGER